MKRIILLVLAVLLICPSITGAENIFKKGEIINLDRCIEIALRINPTITIATNAVNINQSKVGQAQANYYPQVEWSSGYAKNSPVSSRTDSSYDAYSSSIGLRQTIFDFGKTSTNVRIQKLNLNSSRFDLENVSDEIIFSVKQAYYGVLQAKRTRDVAEETVTQFNQQLEQAKGFYEVGIRPKFDVTKAEVDLSNAKLNLIKAENALSIARVILNNAMGVTDAPEYRLEDNLFFQKYEITFEDAIEKTYENRPDLKSIIAKKEAAEESINLAKKGYYPVVSGDANYEWAGQQFPLEDGWNAGVTVTFPLFSGFSTTYQVKESKATANVLRANEESLRQTIFLEVQQAYLNLKEAEERIPAAELTVKQAEENLELANGRYAAGVGNAIEVTDAQVAYSSAKRSYIQALYDYKVAQASLEKAMGGKR